MKLTTENSSTTTKWRAPCIVHYIRDRERFQTQLVYANGCLRHFNVVIVLNQSAMGESQLGDWLPQKRKKKCMTLLQTLVQSKLKSPAEWAELPSLVTHILDALFISTLSKFSLGITISELLLCYI